MKKGHFVLPMTTCLVTKATDSYQSVTKNKWIWIKLHKTAGDDNNKSLINKKQTKKTEQGGELAQGIISCTSGLH